MGVVYLNNTIRLVNNNNKDKPLKSKTYFARMYYGKGGIVLCIARVINCVHIYRGSWHDNLLSSSSIHALFISHLIFSTVGIDSYAQ